MLSKEKKRKNAASNECTGFNGRETSVQHQVTSNLLSIHPTAIQIQRVKAADIARSFPGNQPVPNIITIGNLETEVRHTSKMIEFVPNLHLQTAELASVDIDEVPINKIEPGRSR